MSRVKRTVIFYRLRSRDGILLLYLNSVARAAIHHVWFYAADKGSLHGSW